MDLRHYSAEPIALDRAREYKQQIYFKPRGFWVSVEGEYDWPWFCRSEDFGVERLATLSTVTLKSDANILHLKRVSAIRSFHDDYSAELVTGVARYIDWGRVASDYDGIIIAPYQWSLRLDIQAAWYYSWDVASGCIWNLDAIETLVSETDTDTEGGKA